MTSGWRDHPPATRRVLPPRQRRQCSFFRGKVGLGVDIGGIERHVSEPRTDCIDVDARLKKMSGGRMANDVGTDPFSLQGRDRGTQPFDIAFNERMNAITRQRLSATVHEQVRLDRALPREMTEVLESCGPERASTLLVPFTRDSDGFGVPVNVADPKGSCFTYASTGVVKKQQQRVITSALS